MLDFWGLFPMESDSSHPQSRVLKILIRFPLKNCPSGHGRMTADVRRRGFRFAPLLLAACNKHVCTNAFLRHGGRTTRHRPPPIGSQSLPLKCNSFSPRGLREDDPRCTHRNASQIPPQLPLPMLGRIPQSEGLSIGRGGTTQRASGE